ncbi:sigma-54 interaction domain-containing protein [Thermodesulfobacteriota bacterium]
MTLQIMEQNLENREITSEEKFQGFIGESKEMKEIFSVIERVADSNSTIMVYGESGTGKEMVAKAIHQCSSRRHKPFIAINCGAIPENILESELFGHVKGAFTGAINPKAGKFELANGGTIFLDEIGDMSSDLQVKVLRVLEEREFERVGGSKTINVDIRVIAATHRDLEAEVKNGNFREDLFYRLEVIPINLPPLRKRKTDIPYLIDHFLESLNEKVKRNVKRISDEALGVMEEYNWPGNVRELRNIMERLIVLSDGDVINSKDIPSKLKEKELNFKDSSDNTVANKGIGLNSKVSDFQKALNVKPLEKSNWVKDKVGKLLQFSKTTPVEKIGRHHLEECTSH